MFSSFLKDKNIDNVRHVPHNISGFKTQDECYNKN